MSKSKYTKGPWKLFDAIIIDEVACRDACIGVKDLEYAYDINPIVGLPDNEADARLISKAPEMLEMLIKIHDALEHRKGTVSNFEIRLLIMKARDGGFKDE